MILLVRMNTKLFVHSLNKAAFCIISDAGGGPGIPRGFTVEMLLANPRKGFFQIVPDKVDSGVGYLKLDVQALVFNASDLSL